MNEFYFNFIKTLLKKEYEIILFVADGLGEEKIKGIRKFSFIKPRARNYIHEWLFHELAGEGKLIKLKYDFVNLKINGESQGLYVFEEGFDKDLIERNRRRNGNKLRILIGCSCSYQAHVHFLLRRQEN